MKWRRVAAGVYETHDGQHRIIRTEWEGNGPRGGTTFLWEHATPDEYSGWVIDVDVSEWTLRDAKREVEKLVQSQENGGAR